MISVKKVSRAGGISIPVAIRREYGINANDTFKVEVATNGDVVFKRHISHCIFCDNEENVTMFKGKPICNRCKVELGGETNE